MATSPKFTCDDCRFNLILKLDDCKAGLKKINTDAFGKQYFLGTC